jgi:hypothetical protein
LRHDPNGYQAVVRVGVPSSDPDPDDTAPLDEMQDLIGATRGRWVRRSAIAAMAVFVLLGLTNVLGARSANATAADGAVLAELQYPAATRGGLPTSWSLTVERTDGAALGSVTVRTTASFLDAFDHNDLVPTPDHAEQDERWTTWRFDQVTASQLVIRLDMRTQPNARWKRTTTTEVVAGDAAIELTYTTWVLP